MSCEDLLDSDSQKVEFSSVTSSVARHSVLYYSPS